MPKPLDLKLITKADAAAVFGVCTKTIDNYIRMGLMPKPVPFASREYWHPEVFAAFLDRTFRCDAPDGKDQPSLCGPGDAVNQSDIGLRQRRRAICAEAGSNPTARQQARQRLRLRFLNGGDNSTTPTQAGHMGSGKVAEPRRPEVGLGESNKDEGGQPYDEAERRATKNGQ